GCGSAPAPTKRARTAAQASCPGPSRFSGLSRGPRRLREPPGDSVTQLAPQDLPGGADRELLEHFETLGQLEAGDALLHQERRQPREVERGAGAQHDEGARLLAEHRVGHADDAAAEHRGMRDDEILDLVAADLLAAAVDQVLLATLGEQPAAPLAHDV